MSHCYMRGSLEEGGRQMVAWLASARLGVILWIINSNNSHTNIILGTSGSLPKRKQNDFRTLFLIVSFPLPLIKPFEAFLLDFSHFSLTQSLSDLSPNSFSVHTHLSHSSLSLSALYLSPVPQLCLSQLSPSVSLSVHTHLSLSVSLSPVSQHSLSALSLRSLSSLRQLSPSALSLSGLSALSLSVSSLRQLSLSSHSALA